MTSIRRGSIVWAELDSTMGREQGGRRPVLVVASDLFLTQADTLTIIVPATSVDRGWPNHVQLKGKDTGLSKPTYAMTEQIRTITRDRIHGVIGVVDKATMKEVDGWLRDFLGLI